MNSSERGPARKPDVRVVAKLKVDRDGKAVYVDIGAWWRQEDGKLRGSWDRGIAAIKMADGRVLKCEDAFLNLQEQRPITASIGTSGHGGSAKHTSIDASDVEDDLPF